MFTRQTLKQRTYLIFVTFVMHHRISSFSNSCPWPLHLLWSKLKMQKVLFFFQQHAFGDVWEVRWRKKPWALMTSSRYFLTALLRLSRSGSYSAQSGLMPGGQSMSLCLFGGGLFWRSPPFYWRKCYLEAQTGCPAGLPGLWTTSPPPSTPSGSILCPQPPSSPSAPFCLRKITSINLRITETFMFLFSVWNWSYRNTDETVWVVLKALVGPLEKSFEQFKIQFYCAVIVLQRAF